MTAHRGGLLVSGRYGVSDRFRLNMLNTAILNQIYVTRLYLRDFDYKNKEDYFVHWSFTCISL